MGRGSGPDKMDEDAELEEGEACSIDPDIALSYIDEKIQSVLGHFQKDFEGGVSAENLGAKFGGYGSFLPMYQRSPTIWSQPKSPQRVQTHTTPRSPNHSHREGAAHSSSALPDATLSQKGGTAVPHGMHSLHETKVSMGDGSCRNDSNFSSSQVAEKFPVGHQQSPNKSQNPTDQRTLKFRIKVGLDKTATKNAEIYSGLGLISPTSSAGNSPAESGGIPFESQETPNRLPASILEMLNSFSDLGGLLLSPLVSPLHDGFISFAKNLSLEGKSAPIIKVKHNHSARVADGSASKLGNGDIAIGKHRKGVVQSETLKADDTFFPINENSAETVQTRQDAFSDVTHQHLSDPTGNTGESLRNSHWALETIREPENGRLLKNRAVRKDKVKDGLLGADLVNDEPFESVFGKGGVKFEHQKGKSSSVENIGKNQMKISQDILLDCSDGKRSKVNRMPVSLKADSDISESDRDSKGAGDHLVQKGGMRSTSHEQDELRMPASRKKFSSESKKKSKVSQVNGKLSSDAVQGSRRAGSSAAAKGNKGSMKDVYKVRDIYKDMFDANREPSGQPVDPVQKLSGDRPKDSNFDTVKEKHAHTDRSKDKSSHNKFDSQLVSAALVKDTPNSSVPPTNGLGLEVQQAAVAPVLIEEDWVCCDRCQKWRLLPYGTKPEQLPEKWLCSMLNWLSGMNRCDISEEETTKALHALYQLPLPENQNGVQYHADRTAPGVNSVDAHHFKQDLQNPSLEHISSGKKKKPKVKETSKTGSNTGLTLTSNVARNFQPDTAKREIVTDMKPINKASGQHRNKSDSTGGKHPNKQEQEHVTGGDAKSKRKIKRESDQYGQATAKKSKTDGAFDINYSQASGGNVGGVELSSNTSLPSAASLKDNQRNSLHGYSKDVKSEEGNVLQSSVRNKRESVADTLGNGSLDMRNCNESQMSVKKRKVKNLQTSQNSEETLRSDGDNKIPVKEQSNDSGFRRDKKPRVPQTDVKDFGRDKDSDDIRRKHMMTRMLSSGSKDNKTERSFDREKQVRKYRVKVASQLTMEDLESLKKDLASEPLPMAATSSSSKVSDTCKRRANYQEVKGSPVESVSSSPMRMSTMNGLSPMRTESLGANDVKVGDFPTTRNPRKFVDGDGNSEIQQSRKAKKKKAHKILRPVSFNNHVLDFRESDGGDKFGGENEVGLKPSLFGNDHLDKNYHGILEGHSPCPTATHVSEPYLSQDRITKNHHNTVSSQGKYGRASSLQPKDKGRTSDFNCEDALEKASHLPNNQGILNSKKNSRVGTEIDQNHAEPCGEVLGDVKRPFSGQSSFKSAKSNNNVGKRDSRKENQLQLAEHERSGAKASNSFSVDTSFPVQQHLNQDLEADRLKNISTKSHVNQCPEDKHDMLPSAAKLTFGSQNGNLLHEQHHDLSACGDVSKESKDLVNAIQQSGSRHITGHSVGAPPVIRDLSGPSLARRDASCQAASVALKEAEELRDFADRLKNGGFGDEWNEAYFQAALKFLLGASLLESNCESSKHGEMNQMQTYINAAKLCETCAHEYERRQEMAAAALAYKCMEVAYMRVVYCKNSSTNRLWHELHANLQMVPQGESPSSSASDIDNLNNQALADKAALSKSNGSHVGNHIIAPRNRPNFVRLLDFTKDVNSAMEASRKSQNAFTDANVILEEAKNNDGIISVKRVIDFSFQDVEELVRLVWIAKAAISRQGFSGSRD